LTSILALALWKRGERGDQARAKQLAATLPNPPHNERQREARRTILGELPK
jgi:hypothetical protein